MLSCEFSLKRSYFLAKGDIYHGTYVSSQGGVEVSFKSSSQLILFLTICTLRNGLNIISVASILLLEDMLFQYHSDKCRW